MNELDILCVRIAVLEDSLAIAQLTKYSDQESSWISPAYIRAIDNQLESLKMKRRTLTEEMLKFAEDSIHNY